MGKKKGIYYQHISEHQIVKTGHKETGKSRVSDFSKVTLESSRLWGNVLNVLRENYHKHRLLPPAKHPIKYEGQIKIFSTSGSQKFISYPSFLRKVLRNPKER